MHISLFPPDQRDALEFSFLLSSCLDIFEARMPFKTVDQDFGLLQAVDERLAMYGWLTNTGIKFVIVVDMEGRSAPPGTKLNVAVGLRDSDLKPVRVLISPVSFGGASADCCSRHSEHFKQLILTFCGIPFICRMNQNRPVLTLNAEHRLLRSQVQRSSRK